MNKLLTYYKAHKKTVWILALIFASFIWGTTFIITKETTQHIDPISFIVGRFLFSCILLSFLYHRDLRHPRHLLSKEGLILGLILSYTYIVGTIGVQYTSASNATLISNLFIIITPFLEVLFFKKKVSAKLVVATVLCSIGLILISGLYSLHFNFGDLLMLSTAFFFSLHLVYAEHFAKHIPTKSLIVTQFFVVLIVALLIGFSQGKIVFPNTLDTFLPIMYLSVFATVIVFEIIINSEKFVESTKIAMILALEGVFTLLLAYGIGLEEPEFIKVIGAILLISGIIVAETRKRLKHHK